MSGYEFKPRFWPTIFTIIMLGCMVSLGFWQIHRLEWKLGLIEQIETRAFMDPIKLPDDTSNLDDLEYQSVQVTGQFNNDQEMTMYSVGPNGEPGYDLYTPFYTENGIAIIVNRGWVPERIKDQSTRPDTIENSTVTIEGLLRKPGAKLWYGPENEPENNNWYYGNLPMMAQEKGIGNPYPMYLFEARDQGDNSFPVAGRTEFNIVNNHLDYVLTWFGLAITLVVIYLVAHIKKKEPN